MERKKKEAQVKVEKLEAQLKEWGIDLPRCSVACLLQLFQLLMRFIQLGPQRCNLPLELELKKAFESATAKFK